jgi:hypothetical protein
MRVRGLAAALTLALGTSLGAGAAHATTYLLTVDGCTGGCLGSNTQLGTVTVTENGGALDFSVVLDNGAVFNSAGNSPTHHALVFDLNSGGASLAGLGYSNFTTVNASNVTVSTSDFAGAPPPSPYTDSPFGSSWSNAVNYVGSAEQGGAESNFSFVLSDNLGNLTLGMLVSPITYNGQPIILASDVYANGNTGNVGATGTTGGVPEPEAWGLMLMGVFSVGAAMRLQRRKALATA